MKTSIGMLLIVSALAQQQPQSLPPLPPGMMPYVAILDPQFIPASEATFLEDDFILIGVARGNVAKAYPAADLGQHGSVNDQMSDGPIEVTWCGTCNTGVVFRAQIKGRVLHFDYDSMVSGNEVHKDRETGSRWQQATGEAISGPLKGSRLELYPFVRTTWKEWRRRYPNTLVLKPLPGYAERIPGLDKRQRAITLTNEGAAPAAAFGNDDRLPPKEIVAGLQIGNATKAYPFSALRIARVVNDRVGDIPVLVVHQPSSDTTTAFDARAKGKILHFRAVDDDASSLIDLETNSSWNAYGLSLKGPLKGTQLKTLILMSEFWFAWSEFRPQTEVFTANTANLEFTVKDVHGKDIALHDYQGKVILLDFWATWCAPCKKEIPEFIDLYNRYKSRGFVVLGVSVDESPSVVKKFVQELKVNYPILLGGGREDLQHAFEPPGFPTAYIIGRDGRIVARHTGLTSPEELERTIQSLL